MSEPINLDLVELRAKLRGWECERRANRLNVWGPAGWIWFDSWAYGGDAVAKHGPLLTAPHWTLERLLSEPPEGWRVVPPADPDTAVHVLARGDDPEATRVALGFVDSHGLLVSANVPGAAVGPEGLARLAERLKAAADLALILAEVEP